MKNNSFVFYESFRDATRDIPEKDRLALYEAVMDYALYDKMPEGLSNITAPLFKLIKPQLDANNKRREGGKKGGRSQRNEDKPMVPQEETYGLKNDKPMVLQEKTIGTEEENHRLEKNKPNVNVNGNVNVNVNGNGEDSASAHGLYDPEVKETFSLLTSESSELFPSQVTRESVLQWCDDVGHDLVRATIHQVFSENEKDKKPWKYIEKRLIDYHGRGIRTQEEVTAYETSRKNNRKAAPSIPTYEPDEMDFDAVMERMGVTG